MITTDVAYAAYKRLVDGLTPPFKRIKSTTKVLTLQQLLEPLDEQTANDIQTVKDYFEQNRTTLELLPYEEN